MTALPDMDLVHKVTGATWPAAATRPVAGWTIRDGQGGGKRVSAATLDAGAAIPDLPPAERAMQALGQPRLFMVRHGQDGLDARLAQAGYRLIDPVNAYVCPLDVLTGERPPRLSSFDIWEPMAIQRDIWATGGIGPARVEVMHRVRGPKTTLFARHENRPAATGFVALHAGVAMIHALEVLNRARRAGVGRNLTRHAAQWATAQGGTHLAVLCTCENAAANALYASLGMTLVGQYHYRIKEEPAPT